MSGYLKQRLYEALHSLVGADDLDKRLTYAGTAILFLQDRDVPEQHRESFASIRGRLLRTPLSTERSYQPRQISEDDAKTLARDILGLFTDVMGGL